MRAVLTPGYWGCLRKTFFWIVGNAMFGLFPMLFMLIVYSLGEGKVGKDEIDHLIHDGLILFVSIAIMGSVMVDYALSDLKLKWPGILVVYIMPLGLVAIISIEYLLINLKIIPNLRFDLTSGNTKFVVGIS